jgi:hypothetical protein
MQATILPLASSKKFGYFNDGLARTNVVVQGRIFCTRESVDK